MATQRAFVYVERLTWSAAGGNVRISPIWANSGTTPTRKLRIGTNWKASHGELPPDSTSTTSGRRRNCSSARARKAEFGAVFIPMRDIQAAIEQRLHLYVWGRATYEDHVRGHAAAFLRILPSPRGRGRDARQDAAELHAVRTRTTAPTRTPADRRRMQPSAAPRRSRAAALRIRLRRCRHRPPGR